METFWQCSKEVTSILEMPPNILSGGNRSMIVRRQAIVSYTPHWLKLSRSVTSPTQVSLPDKTQHSQGRDIHVPGEIRICNPSKWRPQTHYSDREGNEISKAVNIIIIIVYRYISEEKSTTLLNYRKQPHLALNTYCGQYWSTVQKVYGGK